MKKKVTTSVVFYWFLFFSCLCWNGSEILAQNNRLWSTYFGGSGVDVVNSVTTDALGNVYMAGQTNSTSNIASNGFQNTFGGAADVYLIKVDANGNKLWATYFGGSGVEWVSNIFADVNGNIYMAGHTDSQNNITFGGFQNAYGGGLYDAFLAKFDAAGNRIWSTYFGQNGRDESYGVCTDAFGNVYLSGMTNATSNIAFGGFQNNYGGGVFDAFLVKFTSSGNRIWSTYYGGGGADYGTHVEVDANGNIYMSGYTSSTNNIAFNGAQNFYGGSFDDAFLVKFNAAGNRIWSTYYGGSGREQGLTTCIDVSGNVYLAGVSSSSNNIAFAGFQNSYGGGLYDVFLVKFDALGNRIWGTYYGGVSNEELSKDGLALDNFGNIFLAGDSYSSNSGNIIALNGFQNSLVGTENLFLAKFNSSGSRECATYYGQNHEEEASVALDNTGNIYLAGAAFGASPGLALGGFQIIYGGGAQDGMLAKFTSCINNTLTVSHTVTTPLCYGQCNGSATASAVGIAPYSYSWSTTPIQITPTAVGLCPGSYTVIVTDANNNTATSVVTITQPPLITATITANSPSLCLTSNGSATVSVLGGAPGYSYSWAPTGGLSATANNLSPGTYTVTATDLNGCTQTATTIITQQNTLLLLVSSTPSSCNIADGSATVSPINGTPIYTYFWNPMGTTTPTATNLATGTYTVTVTDANGCTNTTAIYIPQISGTIASISSDVNIQLGSYTILNASGGVTYNWFPATGLSCTNCANPTALPTQTTIYCVEVENNNCKDTACVKITVERPCNISSDLAIPNAFSPNEDFVNDEFCLQGWEDCIETFEILIYNRWGEKVFESTEVNFCWDGVYKDLIMDSQVFVYFINAKFANSSEQIIMKGNISLIK